MFANHGWEDKIYPLITIEIAIKREIKRSTLRNTPERLFVFNLLKTQKCKCTDNKNYPSISTAQDSLLVSPLPQIPWALMSQRDNEFGDVLERYAQCHLVICQILQILPSNERYSEGVWSCTTKSWS
jgi:hypothetical protein